LTGQSRLCLAGGVALNCVANGRILAEGPFDALFVQPAAGDDGAALGNALLGIQRLTGRPASWQFGSPYLGRSYRDEEINDAVLRAGDRVIVETPDDLAPRIADDIAAGRIVAVFRGGCEYGPRALGHRSILCDPRPTWMKDHVNARVKHREAFRPFAPMVLQERAAEYFAPHVASPYMLLTATVLHPDLLPGITHVDGSARVQTVSREQELFLHEVISRFSDRTGLPVLLNTSFNDQEPIVETPDDAITCFCDTGIDVLYLEGLRVTKPGTQW
jgi:carbamoyltransferase